MTWNRLFIIIILNLIVWFLISTSVPPKILLLTLQVIIALPFLLAHPLAYFVAIFQNRGPSPDVMDWPLSFSYKWLPEVPGELFIFLQLFRQQSCFFFLSSFLGICFVRRVWTHGICCFSPRNARAPLFAIPSNQGGYFPRYRSGSIKRYNNVPLFGEI